jgi:phosphonopyruvate decarboxylase
VISPEIFYKGLISRGASFFAGVPDSFLAEFSSYLSDFCSKSTHIVAANEGNAIALGLGFHLATKRIPVVYMQNSGLGNAINPLVSLASKEVYKIPLLLIIGWRGEPGIKDEPQHKMQGKVTLTQLDVLCVPYKIIDGDASIEDALDWAMGTIAALGTAVALVVRKNTFSSYKQDNPEVANHGFTREEALLALLELADPNDLVLSTTGKLSRELYEARLNAGIPQNDFLSVGGMGHLSSIACGVALGAPEKRVLCLDGDGALIMHMGAMPIIVGAGVNNFKHILFNNQSHESVGGQKTVAGAIDFKRLSEAFGYSGYASASNRASLMAAWKMIQPSIGVSLLEIKVSMGSRVNLGRPTDLPRQNMERFMKFIANE